MKKKNGFTLVELLAVIVILAIIMIIAIPSVMETTAKAKKQSFYLYAESIQSKAEAKYIADNNEDTDSTEGSTCKVYDIADLTTDNDTKEDTNGGLGSSNYEGWAKVERVRRISSTTGIVSVTLQSDSGPFEYIKYCIDDSNTCTPNKTYAFPEDSTKVTLSQSTKYGNYLRYTYTIGDDESKTLTTSEVKSIQSTKPTGTATVNIKIDDSSTMESVYTCETDKSKCTPSTEYTGEKSTSMTISQTMDIDKTLCVKYTYKNSEGEEKTATKCSHSENDDCSNDKKEGQIYCDFDYITTLTIKNKDYAIENVEFESGMSRETFYDYIEEFKENHKTGKTYSLTIASPTCSASDTVTYKGVTTTHANADTTTTKATAKTSTIDTKTCPNNNKVDVKFKVKLEANGGTVTNNELDYCTNCEDTIENPTRKGYVFDGWYYTKSFDDANQEGDSSNKIADEYIKNIKTNPIYYNYVDADGNRCLKGYDDVTLYAKWSVDPKSTTEITTSMYTNPSTTEKTTYILDEVETTTIDTKDYTLLLDTLTISGYNIDFSPIKFYYDITIPSTVSSLGISYQVHSPDTTDAEIIGNTDLSQGRNLVKVHLTNRETGTSSYYTIIVTNLGAVSTKVTQPQTSEQTEWNPESGKPDPSLAESNATLSNLQISGYALGFDPSKYEYTLSVNSSDPLMINATPAEKNAFINIEGNEKLTDGSVVSVFVQSPNGFYNKTYKIEIKYEKEVSNSTKYLKTLMIILGIILAIILIINYINKKKKFSIIKRKEADKASGNNGATVNTPVSAAASTNPAAYIPGMINPEGDANSNNSGTNQSENDNTTLSNTNINNSLNQNIPGIESPIDSSNISANENQTVGIIPGMIASDEKEETPKEEISSNASTIPGMIQSDDKENQN